MKILLTGSAGYVGSALYRRLLRDGHTVAGVDTQWFMEDKKDPPQDVRAMKSIGGADLVIHLAAISNDPSVSEFPRMSWETGVLATMRLAEMCKAAGARMIYASSVSVYGANRGAVKEDQDLRPLSDYNKTKMAAERVLLSYPEINVQIVRPATICGLSPRMRLDLTVNMLTMQALRDGVMTLYGGQQMRPSIHLDDMIELYCWLIDHPEVIGIYNAGFENDTLLGIAEQIQWMVKGSRIEITPQRDDRSYMVNSDKLQIAGFRPRKSILHAIQELMIAWETDALKDEPQAVNLNWMRKLAIKDDMADAVISKLNAAVEVKP